MSTPFECFDVPVWVHATALCPSQLLAKATPDLMIPENLPQSDARLKQTRHPDTPSELLNVWLQVTNHGVNRPGKDKNVVN